MAFMYEDFKRLLPEDKKLIHKYFKFSKGDIVTSAYGEVIQVGKDSYGKNYSKDKYMIPLFTIDLLVKEIENLEEGKIISIEREDDYMKITISLNKKLGCKSLKGYTCHHEIFSGLFNIFLNLLKKYKG